jgi:hypothetical protein
MRTAPPYARFRCLVCKEYVVGTATGHCARCGFVPPTAPTVPPLAKLRVDMLVVVLALAIAGVLVAAFLAP